MNRQRGYLQICVFSLGFFFFLVFIYVLKNIKQKQDEGVGVGVEKGETEIGLYFIQLAFELGFCGTSCCKLQFIGFILVLIFVV